MPKTTDRCCWIFKSIDCYKVNEVFFFHFPCHLSMNLTKTIKLSYMIIIRYNDGNWITTCEHSWCNRFDNISDVKMFTFNDCRHWPVCDLWILLVLPLQEYVPLFKKHGFDNTMFISGMTETELKRIGIKKIGELRYLMTEISKLEAFEIEPKVPVSIFYSTLSYIYE